MNNETNLQDAARCGEVDICQSLIKNGADLNEIFEDGIRHYMMRLCMEN